MLHLDAVLAYIANRDLRLMRLLHRWQAPRWVRLWMIGATRGGDGWLWVLAGLAVLRFGGEQRYAALSAAGMAAAIGMAFYLTLKPALRRDRPVAIEPHCWATLLPPDRFSFPSGHSIVAFAVAVSLAAFYPGAAAALFFAAVSIAVSRMLLGMHFLSDVIVGSVLGALIGLAACRWLV